ncbi:MAG: hypothetical protein R6V13_12320 [Anaerolineae bacterium]
MGVAVGAALGVPTTASGPMVFFMVARQPTNGIPQRSKSKKRMGTRRRLSRSRRMPIGLRSVFISPT